VSDQPPWREDRDAIGIAPDVQTGSQAGMISKAIKNLGGIGESDGNRSR
jgi:hypothetical protein